MVQSPRSRARAAASRWPRGALVLGLALGLVAACGMPKARAAPPVRDGRLDLRGYGSPRVDSPAIPLSGEWRIYAGRLLDDAALEGPAAPAPDGLLKLPGRWRNAELADAEIGRLGVATMTLEVALPEPSKDLAIKLGRVYTSYELDCNGARIAESGAVGPDAASSRPSYRTHVAAIPDGARELRFTLRIANFSHGGGGGIRSDIVLGSKAALDRHADDQERLSWFLFGALLLMGIYHFGLYLLRRSDRSTLYFGVFCTFIALRSLMTGYSYLYWAIPEATWGLLLRLDFLTIYAGVPAFNAYLLQVFPGEVSRRIVRVISYVSLGFAAAALVGSTVQFSTLLPAFELFIVVCSLYNTYTMILAVRRRREGGLVFCAGFFVFFATIINDILSNHGLLHTGQYLPLGLFAFVFSQAFLLSQRSATAFVRVEELATIMSSQNKRLQELDRLKDDFLANTSHELRTPLHGIIGLAESLIEGATGELPEATRRNLAMIAMSGRRLSTLVNDILDLAKARSKALVLQQKPVDLHAAIDIVLLLSRSLLRSDAVELVNAVPEGSPAVLADENRLQQILYNLVGNAIKFTAAGRIEVALAAEPGADGALTIVVRDTGIGIPADKHETIFEYFEQADGSTAREYGGAGIGLHIVRQLVELHGGAIWVESEVGVGSSFYFTLPRADAAADAPEPSAASQTHYALLAAALDDPRSPAAMSSAALAQRVRGDEPEPEPESTTTTISGPYARVHRILAVDDEPVNLQVLRNQLALHDLSVEVAHDGEEALKVLRERGPFDLVLLDVMMPRLTGYEVCAEIRAEHSPSELPVIMLTAKDRVHDLIAGFEVGANDYITKPFSKAELLARIHAHIRLAETQEAYARFVPSEFLQHLEKESILDVALGDHVQREMTVMFADIRSFTALSEQMTPRENFDFINAYLQRMEPPITGHRGFIDKYIGDAIMALFPDSADDAVGAAIAMLAALRDLNVERVAAGRPALSVGIGLNTGLLMLGTVGGQRRMDGTVISDAVNLAARIETMTRLYGAPVLLAEGCRAKLRDPEAYATRIIDRVLVKGKSQSVTVYELIVAELSDAEAAKARHAPAFSAAFDLYQRRDFAAAARAFAAYAESCPEDQAARLYIERCRALGERGVTEDWDGVYRLAEV